MSSVQLRWRSLRVSKEVRWSGCWQGTTQPVPFHCVRGISNSVGFSAPGAELRTSWSWLDHVVLAVGHCTLPVRLAPIQAWLRVVVLRLHSGLSSVLWRPCVLQRWVRKWPGPTCVCKQVRPECRLNELYQVVLLLPGSCRMPGKFPAMVCQVLIAGLPVIPIPQVLVQHRRTHLMKPTWMVDVALPMLTPST